MKRINYLEEYHCAYHRIKDSKTFTIQDVRSLGLLGVPIIKELSIFYTEKEHKRITVNRVCNRVSKGKIPYEDVLFILDESCDIRRIWRENVLEY